MIKLRLNYLVLCIFLCLSTGRCNSEKEIDVSSYLNDRTDELARAGNKTSTYGFWSSFFYGFTIIFFSEIGDKTFLLCIFFSMKIGAFLAYIASTSTLICLNSFWIMVGSTLHLLVYKQILDWAAICVFFAFGLILLIEGIQMKDKKLIVEIHKIEEDHDKEEMIMPIEFSQKEKLLDEKKIDSLYTNEEFTPIISKLEQDQDIPELQLSHGIHVKDINFESNNIASVIWGFCISLVFAECGDKSQISAIAIASIYEFKGVLCGSCLAIALSSLIAVTIGLYFSEYASEKLITLTGSVIFLAYSFDILMIIEYSG